MAYVKSGYMKLVLEDLEGLEARGPVVKASLVEKMTVKSVSPHKLHANPDDEFSQPDIGPNDSIIANYSQIARRSQAFHSPVFEEPIIVYKLKYDGYLILNGHHRWAGAIDACVPKVRISIENPRS